MEDVVVLLVVVGFCYETEEACDVFFTLKERDHTQSLHDWNAGKHMCCSGIKRKVGRNNCVCFNLIYNNIVKIGWRELSCLLMILSLL